MQYRGKNSGMDDHFDIGRVFEIGKFDITRLTCIFECGYKYSDGIGAPYLFLTLEFYSIVPLTQFAFNPQIKLYIGTAQALSYHSNYVY